MSPDSPTDGGRSQLAVPCLPAARRASIVTPWSSACRRRPRSPSSAWRSHPRALSDAGHDVLVETGAGTGSSFRDEEYAAAGARVVDVVEVWDKALLVLKVKEPVAEEVARIREGQTLFTYLHLAPMPDLVRALQRRGVLAIAYETVERADGSLPLLTPMSEVAGRLAIQEGAHYLGRAYGGRGIMLSGVPGVPPGNVVVLGAGTVGLNAAKAALGLGADVSLLDVNLDRLRHADDVFSGRVVTLASNAFNIEQVAQHADLRADQRHAALRARARPQGHGARRERERRARPRGQHLARTRRLSSRRG